MSFRYFFGENADRPVRAGKINHAFEIIGRTGGTAQGVVAVPEDRAAAFAAEAAKLGVIEITQAEYEAAILKKKQTRYSPGYVERGRPSPAAALTGKGAVVVPGGSVKPKLPGEGMPVRVEEAVVVASAATAPTETPAQVATAVRRPRAAAKKEAAAEPPTTPAALATVDEGATL